MTDADRFEAFVRKYQDMVFGTAVRLLGDPTEAENVSQTVFLKAFERFQALDAQPAAAGWLKTVTTNACLNHLSRVRSRWRFFSELGRTDLGGESAAYEDGLVSQESPAFDLERADGQAHLEQAIRDLPSHQRVPLALFHFQDMSYQQIATTLGVLLGKVKTDIHRARQALKRRIASDETR